MNAGAHERVRDGRLPRAQHDPRRVRADRAAGTYSAAQLARVPRAGHRGRDERRRHVDARDPARRRVRQPGPAAAGRPRAGARRASARARSTSNDEQIDDSLRSVLFQVPKPGIPDPSVCGAPVVNPGCFSGVVDLGAIDVQRGRDHGIPELQRPPAGLRARRRRRRSRRSPARRPIGCPARQSTSTTRASSTSSQLARRRRQPVAGRRPERGRRRRACGARRWPRG